jgi:hypothetical protein
MLFHPFLLGVGTFFARLRLPFNIEDEDEDDNGNGGGGGSEPLTFERNCLLRSRMLSLSNDLLRRISIT